MALHNDPAALAYAALGLSEDAAEDEIRAAYVRALKQFPPDKAPEQFERIRDAYECLRNPKARIAHMLRAVHPNAPLTGLLDESERKRNFLGTGPWLQVLKKGARHG